jgi:hypothetical protein
VISSTPWADGGATRPARSLDGMTDEGMAACTLCGKSDTDQPGPSDWLAVEVSGTDEDGGMWWVNEYFCCQAHAAEWLQRPLARPEPSPPYAMTTRDRLVGLGLASGLGVLVALAGLGALTVLRFLIDHV